MNGNDFSAKLIFNDIRNYLAGRFVGATRDEFFLNEVVKLILSKQKIKKHESIITDPMELSKLYREIFKTITDKYQDLFDKGEEIELDPISIQYVDKKLDEVDLLNINRDPIGDAYEIFMGDAIKGQSGQFFTPKNVAQALVEMVDPKPDDKVLDLACGAGGFLIALLSHYRKNGYAESELKDAIMHNINGVDKDNYLTRLAKIHFACLVEDIPQITCADSVEWNEEILGSGEEVYDCIVTNPPFGTNIKSGSEETLMNYELAYKQKNVKEVSTPTDTLNSKVPPQVVFVERCIRLLKKGGKLGIVVPESLISSKKYKHVVEFIMRTCNVKSVLGMPEELFKTSGKGGTHTKTCLLVLEKKQSDYYTNNLIYMAEADWCGHDSRGREIPKNDIPSIVDEFKAHSRGEQLVRKTYLSYTINEDEIDSFILAPKFYMGRQSLKDYNGLQETHDVLKLEQLIDEHVVEFNTGHEVGKLSYGTGDIPFVRTSDISNWEIKSDPKHSLSEEIYEQYRERQNIQEGDILMVKDGTYLIGTCAMITKYDIKMVYQSHLYKIRVNENKYGLTSYLLLAILSSEYVQEQIMAKVYSQDIINSLGTRYKDLFIPIPKSQERRNKINKMVKKSIDERIEARELARKARIEVLR